MKTSPEEHAKVVEIRDSIRDGLSKIGDTSNWLEEYEQWRSLDSNQFDSLLEIVNPLDLNNAGNKHNFDLSDPEDVLDLDVYCMSAFLSERLLKSARQTFCDLRREKNRTNKLQIIKRYFELVDSIFQSQELAGGILTLHDCAEKKMVLAGKRSLDFYVSFFSLKENLRKRSTESLYMLFTYWRITKEKKDLKPLISSLVDYIQTYFDDFDKDPDMHLYYPLEGLISIKKLIVIEHWLEHIAFHTDGIFEKYKELKWLAPTDIMVDEIIETNQISNYEMLLYRQVFSTDDAETVQKKAVCNHGYGVWIKTVDVMHIVCDIFQVLYGFSDEELKKMNTTRAQVLEAYDNMTKVRDYYTRKVFFHQVYFKHERHYLDSQVMDALEEDAAKFSDSVDDIISFVSAIAADDIDSLLQAKQRYLKGISDFISPAQEEQLDELTCRVVEKVKETIQKLNIYNTLYSSVSTEFLPYATALMQYPQIFSSLVSAEYLYKQYVENKTPNPKFDYSCISIMYYMSLEDFLNKLVYTPYADEVLSGISSSDLNDKQWRDTGSKDYVSQFSSFWNKKKSSYILKNSCEIGVLGFLFDGIDKEKEFESFVIRKYPKADKQRIKALGIKLKSVAPRRNNAAHGGNYLTHSDVLADKGHVYDTSAATFKGLILDFLDIIL